MIDFSTFFQNFHFIRPWWFIALIALFYTLWLLKKFRFNYSPWNKFLPKHLSQILIEGNNTSNKNNTTFMQEQSALIKPFFIGLCAITALAGPTWQKLPQPVYQTERGSVLIMDMSYSMYSTDIKPNRLTRARYKAVDLLKKINEGDIGLIAYAGDAFVISPLTQDIKNIELLLPSLSPEIMPELGSNPLAALTLAHDMLKNAGHLHGDIYWFTDDIDNEELNDIYDWSAQYGHKLNILGVGTEVGAPIKLPSGELLKDNSGAIVIPKLPAHKLNGIASKSGGHYKTIANNDTDISLLASSTNSIQSKNSQQESQQESQQMGDKWQEQGAWLLLLVLPLLLTYFRKGSVITFLPLASIPLILSISASLFSQSSFAAEVSPKVKSLPKTDSSTQLTDEKSTLAETWNNLWKTSDQQAQQHYNNKQYQAAAKQFNNPQWQGSAEYKAGNYQAALDAFKQGKSANTANSLYNQGNALAKLQQYDQAIKSYQQALAKNPALQDAKDNIEKIKQLQKQNQSEKDQSKQGKSNDKKGDNKQSKDNQPKDSQSSQDKSKKKNQQNNQSQDNSKDKKSKNADKKQQNEQNKDQNNKNQSSKDQQEKNESEQNKQAKKEQAKKSSEQQKQAKAGKKEAKDQKNKTPAEIAAEQKAKETEQKYQQLLNKVTDDPYLLLRNKMQLEYQKRQHNGANRGATKKW